MTFHWPYYTLHYPGILRDETGRHCFRNAPKFGSVWEAEAWLESNDERGNVRDERPAPAGV